MSERPRPSTPSGDSGRLLPRWIGAVLGLVLLVLGVLLLSRPFAAVGTLLFLLGIAPIAVGATELVLRQGWTGRFGWVRPLVAVMLIVLGVVILWLPGLTLEWAAVLLGAALLALGARDILTMFAEPVLAGRVAQVLGGLALIVFGALVLVWRDVTLLVVGVLFGVWLAVTGFRLLLDAVLHRRRAGEDTRSGAHARSWPRLVLNAGTLALAILLAVVGSRLLGTHAPDAFYTAPATVPSKPGKLLRAEPFTRAIPDGARAWRILYTTTRDDGVPAIASGLVVVPEGVKSPPTIAWAHGTTGVDVSCAPTLLEKPMTAGAMPNTTEALQHGWAIVSTDYVGLGADAPHPYLVGQPEARSVLDAVRASRQLPDAEFGDQVVVWGHSQGGGAALWTGGIAAEYAPELDIVGVAAMAPAANLPSMIAPLADGAAGTLVGPLVLAGYSARYDDVRVQDYLLPEARLLYDETIARCWSDPSFVVSVLEAGVIDRPIWSQKPTEGPLAAHLEANVPTRPIAAPLLIAQGLSDTLVLPEVQQEYVDRLCAAGQQVDYRTFEGKDHMSVVKDGSPLLGQLMDWTQDRLDGKPPENTCHS